MKVNPKSTRPGPSQEPAGQPSSGVIDAGRTRGRPSDQVKAMEFVVDCLPDGVIVADQSGKFLLFNTAAQQILGLVPPHALPTDRGRVNGIGLSAGVISYPTAQLPLVQALRGEKINATEILIRNEHVPDGRWISASALPWRDETGAVHGALLIVRDVGEERKSRELNERLSNVVEQTADSVIITEANGTIVYVNPAFEQTTGYSRNEVLGRNPRLLRSGRHDGEFYKTLWDTVLKGGVFRGTLINRKKNGDLFHAEQTISPIAGADGRCQFLVSVAKDITDRLRNERNEAQLDAARSIQQRLYPREAPQVPGFDIAGAVNPAESLCGDYYDFFPMSGGGLGMTVADVCGHGVGPSILMAQARAYLRSLALAHPDVGEVLCRLNEILTVDGSEREFVTQILVRLAPDVRTLVYANAGHPAGILLGGDGQVREGLGSCGLPLGILTDRVYPTSRVIRMEPGDIVVLFTDGITECCGPTGSEFGTERVLDVVRSHRRDVAHKILKALYDAASGFRSAAPQDDDMTAIICKVEGS
jgi:PAS domain S-box-containing protein